MERELLFPPQNPVAEHQLLAIKNAQIKCAGKKQQLDEEKIKRENFFSSDPFVKEQYLSCFLQARCYH